MAQSNAATNNLKQYASSKQNSKDNGGNAKKKSNKHTSN